MQMVSDERCRLAWSSQKVSGCLTAYDYRCSLGLVLSGKLEVTKPSGRRFIMNVLESGSLFGSAGLFGNETNPVTILTAGKLTVRILFFPSEICSWI